MPATSGAISNTSPLLYLHRIHSLNWLAHIITEVWTPGAVARELEEGHKKGFDVPDISA